MAPSSAVPAACACGRNKLSVKGAPSSVYRCHCTDCRQVHGEDYIHCAAFMADQITVESEDTEGVPASRPVLVRTYCRQCKNHVSNDRLGDDGKTLRRMIPIASFVRAAADGKAPWPTTQDIWYSERVVDVNDDVTKWCRARCTS